VRPDRATAPAPGGRRPGLRLVAPRPLRVCDVALFWGERSGGIRTYLDAKAAWARDEPGIEHHVVVPGAAERHDGGRHELGTVRGASANGYRLPAGGVALERTLRLLRPDVVLLHDPFWAPRRAIGTAHALGARVVAVHHGSAALDAAALPGPSGLQAWLLRRWMRRAVGEADAVMAAVDVRRDLGRPAGLALRLGLHEAFHPRPDVARGDHVLYAGRLSREKGVVRLLAAAARSAEPWPLRLVGDGGARPALERLACRLGLGERVTFAPFVTDREALALAYARAAVVVQPGEHETFGLVAYEAAAAGARVVCCSTAPSAEVVGDLAHTFAPGDVGGLLRAIEAARATARDVPAALALARRSGWSDVLRRELEDLRGLVRGD
jgi:alpha-1,6-mannosyltransferase